MGGGEKPALEVRVHGLNHHNHHGGGDQERWCGGVAGKGNQGRCLAGEECTCKYPGTVSLGAQEPGPQSGAGKGWWWYVGCLEDWAEEHGGHSVCFLVSVLWILVHSLFPQARGWGPG